MGVKALHGTCRPADTSPDLVDAASANRGTFVRRTRCAFHIGQASPASSPQAGRPPPCASAPRAFASLQAPSAPLVASLPQAPSATLWACEHARRFSPHDDIALLSCHSVDSTATAVSTMAIAPNMACCFTPDDDGAAPLSSSVEGNIRGLLFALRRALDAEGLCRLVRAGAADTRVTGAVYTEGHIRGMPRAAPGVPTIQLGVPLGHTRHLRHRVSPGVLPGQVVSQQPQFVHNGRYVSGIGKFREEKRKDNAESEAAPFSF